MRLYLLSLTVASILFAGIASAQQEPGSRNRPAGKETSVTGCLTKSSDGGYVLTDEKTGKQITVTGSADLEKHSANHKVRLTGTESGNGTSAPMTMEVTRIQHISPTCSPESK